MKTHRMKLFTLLTLMLLIISVGTVTDTPTVVDHILEIEPESGTVLSVGESWLSGWTYRKSHVISQTIGAGINYQVAIVAHYGSGTDGTEALGDTVTAGKVYLDSKCRTNFTDVVFTDGDGDTLLDFWMESYYTSDNATFWIEIADDLDSGDQTIYIYYGNSDADPDSSDIIDSFLYGNNFNLSTTRSASNPIMSTAVMPNVLNNGTHYWMYYGDVPATVIKRSIGTDETTWGSGVTTGITSKYCNVWLDGATYRMVYANWALTEIRLATSATGATFTDQGLLVSLGSSGDFDDTALSDPMEIKDGSTYYLYYLGAEGATNRSIGLATSTTGAVSSYTKRGEVMPIADSGWDDTALFDPWVVEYDTDKWMLWYSAHGDGVQRIGYALTTDLDAYSFTHQDYPVFWAGTQEWETSNIINEQSVLIEDDTYKIWYRGSGDNNGEIGYLTLEQDPTTKLPVAVNMSGDPWRQENKWSNYNDRLRNTEATTNYPALWDRTSLTNATIEFILNKTSGYWLGGVFRMTDDDNGYYMEHSVAPGTFKLYKRVSSSFTQIGSTVNYGNFTLGVDYLLTIRINEEGSGLRVKVDVDRVNEASWLESTTTFASGYFGLWNKGDANYDNLRIRKYTPSEPAHSTWGAEEEANNTPTNDQTPSLTNPSDTDHLYARYIEYIITSNCSDLDGYADIDYVELGVWDDTQTTECFTIRFDEDTNTFTEQSGTVNITLNTGGSSYDKSGNTLNVTWLLYIEWACDELVDFDMKQYVVDSGSLSDTDWYETSLEIETRLDFNGFGLFDGEGTNDRGDYNTIGGIEALGDVRYYGTTGNLHPYADEIDVWITCADTPDTDWEAISYNPASSPDFSVYVDSDDVVTGLLTRYYFKAVIQGSGSGGANLGWTNRYDDYYADRLQVTGYASGDTRIDIGTASDCTVTLYYDFDNTMVVTGTWSVNGVTLSYTGDSGIWSFIETKSTTQLVTYDTVADSSTPTDDTHGLSLVDQNGQSLEQIWDQVNMTTVANYDWTIVGYNLTMSATGVYEYDGAAWSGAITWANQYPTKTVVGNYSIDATYITSITDTNYDLTVFQVSVAGWAVWDNITATALSGAEVSTYLKLYFVFFGQLQWEFNGSSIGDGWICKNIRNGTITSTATTGTDGYLSPLKQEVPIPLSWEGVLYTNNATRTMDQGSFNFVWYTDITSVSAVSTLIVAVEDRNPLTTTISIVGTCNAQFTWYVYREGVYNSEYGTAGSSGTSFSFEISRVTTVGEHAYQIYFNSTVVSGSRWFNLTDTVSITYGWLYIQIADQSGKPIDYALDTYVNGSLIQGEIFWGRMDTAYEIAIYDVFGDELSNVTYPVASSRQYNITLQVYSFKVTSWVDGKVLIYIYSSGGGYTSTWLAWGGEHEWHVYSGKSYQLQWAIDTSNVGLWGHGMHYYPALDPQCLTADPTWYTPDSASLVEVDNFGIATLYNHIPDASGGGGGFSDADAMTVVNSLLDELNPFLFTQGKGRLTLPIIAIFGILAYLQYFFTGKALDNARKIRIVKPKKPSVTSSSVEKKKESRESTKKQESSHKQR